MVRKHANTARRTLEVWVYSLAVILVGVLLALRVW
jgi:hypothetical protein